MSNSSVRSSYLKELKETRAEIYVYLSNGIKLNGTVQDYDDGVIILARGNGANATTQMVERTATSTVVPVTGSSS